MNSEETSRYDTVEIDAQKVKDRRLSLKLTQKGLAASMTRASSGYVSVIETAATGVARVSRAVAEELATALGVKSSELLATVPRRAKGRRQQAPGTLAVSPSSAPVDQPTTAPQSATAEQLPSAQSQPETGEQKLDLVLQRMEKIETRVSGDRKSTRLNSSHSDRSRMPSSA